MTGAVLRLIDHFDRQADQVRSPDYNEATLRIQFVNPLFKQLGWDMDNDAGNAEAYKDVINEAAIKPTARPTLARGTASMRIRRAYRARFALTWSP